MNFRRYAVFVVLLIARPSGMTAAPDDVASPILAPKGSDILTARATPSSPISRGPTSEQSREHIAAKVRADVATSSPLHPATTSAGETIVMAPYKVDAAPVRVEMAPPENRIAAAVQTGSLLRFTGKMVTGELRMRGEAGPGSATAGHYGRITLGFSFSW